MTRVSTIGAGGPTSTYTRPRGAAETAQAADALRLADTSTMPASVFQNRCLMRILLYR
jgi:hypothetical protein